MSYYQNREALVMIAMELQEKGWEIFGFRADESDAMTDYFSPASWSGIASKNGYVLVINNNNTYYSNYEVKKYNYDPAAYKANGRIVKLEAMMNDPASTENEKASCAVLIEKEKEKQGIEPTFTVETVYPTFAHGNPKRNNWHIEKDGQIVAKGNGAFAVNSYNWEDETKTPAQQKAEKLAKFIAKIEKVLNDTDALHAEVITETKQVIKPVEKDTNEINVGDLLSFSYHSHFWIVNDVYAVNGQTRVVYELLGSEKRGYQRKANGKRYYQPLTRLEKEMVEGKVKVYTLQEVTEYVEKTVYKKTKRTQKASDAVQIESGDTVTEQQEQANEVVKTEPVSADSVATEATMTINEEKNGIEIKFASKPFNNIIEKLKENGFRWSKFDGGKWWAKNTPERLEFASMLVTTCNGDNAEEEQENASEVNSEVNIVDNNDNVIYHDFTTNNEDEKENINENMNNTFDDLFSKFDNIEITTEQKISPDDLEFCKEQDNIYKMTIGAYNSLKERLNEIAAVVLEHKKKFKEQRYALDAGFSKWELETNILKIKERFIYTVCHYFSSKYSITINVEKMQKKYDTKITYQNIIDEIFIQLDGHNFTEKAEQQLKAEVKDIARNSDRMNIKNNKLIIDAYFVRHDSIWKRYCINEKIDTVIKALQHFENGIIGTNEELASIYSGYENQNHKANFERSEPKTLSKVKSIKVMKNGKLEIEFISNQHATHFANEYCGYKQKAI